MLSKFTEVFIVVFLYFYTIYILKSFSYTVSLAVTLDSRGWTGDGGYSDLSHTCVREHMCSCAHVFAEITLVSLKAMLRGKQYAKQIYRSFYCRIFILLYNILKSFSYTRR